MGALAVIWAPVRTLGRVAGERSVLAGFLVVAVYAAASLAGSAVSFFAGSEQQLQQLPQLPQGGNLPEGTLEKIFAVSQIIGLVFSALWPFILWAVVALVMQLVTGLFGGSGPLSAMFAAVGVALIPFAVLSVTLIPLNGLQAALGFESAGTAVIGGLAVVLQLAALAWTIVLVIIGASLARGVGYGESAGSCAISCAGCLGLIIAVIVVLALIIALVGSAGAPQ